ncbi:MAG TPA: bacterial transcriptional activator domain-containing protein [Ktedonobacteraceae bacterium]|nr:bacterial transcriptional activator domain-containing protein [Ktedonobacteraceae bacterium]
MTRNYEIPDAPRTIRSIQYLAVGKFPQAPTPLVRITTCGLLTLEILDEIVSTDPPQARYRVLTPDLLHGRGVIPALTLLKLLSSRPERFAPNEWLREQFCQAQGEAFSSKRLDSLASMLRDLLCPPAYEALRTALVANTRGISGSGYHLATSSLIWIDHEALAWNVEQAIRMERFGDDPLPFWQRAYELAKRGEYLPDELYGEWASVKREQIAGLLRQSVQALARIYTAQHDQASEEEALLLLRSYWHEHPHDEDALRPLMELLGKRDCYQEALAYYEKLCALLEEDGQRPIQQTQDVAEYVRARQIQHGPVSFGLTRIIEEDPSPFQVQRLGQVHQPPIASLKRFQTTLSVLFQRSLNNDSSEGGQGETHHHRQAHRGEIDLFAIGMQALLLHQRDQQWDKEDLFLHVKQALDEWTPELSYNQSLSRREALCFLASMPLAFCHMAKRSGPLSASLLPEEVLPLYRAGIPACWHFYYEGGQAELERMLPGYLSHLAIFAHTPSSYQKQAAGLLSQMYQLQALLVQEHEDFGEAITYCKKAAFYGQLAEDANLQAMALIRQQDTFLENKRFSQWFLTLKEAETFADRIAPLLQGRIYARLALASAYQSQMHLAFHYTHLAQEIFPPQPEMDPSFFYSHTTHFILYANQALTFLHMRQPQNAWDTLLQARAHVSGATNPRHIDLLSYQLQAAEMLGEQERCCQLFEQLASSLMQFGRAIDRSNAHDAYLRLTTRWPDERRIQRLGGLLPL